MPTPLEIFADPVSHLVFALYAGLMFWEALRPGRPLPVVRGWRLKCLVWFVGYFLLAAYLPLIWDQYLEPYQLFDLTSLGVAGGTLVGLLFYELGAWAWHRLMHAWTPLWRMHQMHHSSERLDTYSAFYFHPLDAVGWTALGSLCLVLGVGLVPQAATNIVVIVTLLSIFQHSNIATPRWLGYFVQRPESHTVHHGRMVHHKNFADLPVFDLIFGTFENPESFEHETGFYPGASSRVGELLLFRDMATEKRTEATPPPSSNGMFTAEVR